MYKSNDKKNNTFIKFSIVGAVGTLIDFGLMNLFTIGFGWDKILAQALSFIAAVINNYILNRYWTYPKSRLYSFWQQFFRFLVISVAGLGIRTPLFWFLSKGITYFADQTLRVNTKLQPEWIGNNAALVICIVVVLLWNYYANRRWTFKTDERKN